MKRLVSFLAVIVFLLPLTLSAETQISGQEPPTPIIRGGTGATTAGQARTNLGLGIGTNVQAYSANLTTFAGIAPSANVVSLLGAADYAAIRTLLGVLGDSTNGQILYNKAGVIGGAPLTVTVGGDIAGKFLPRNDTQANIAGLVLDNGEIAFSSDQKETYLGTGVAGGNIRLLSTPPGIIWAERTSPANVQWQTAAYGNGTFVVLSAAMSAANGSMTSEDGIRWVKRAVPNANYWSSVAYGAGKFVGVSTNGTHRVIYSTNDGATWTEADSSEANGWTGVAYGNGRFVAVAADGTNRAMTSTDGITWTAQAIDSQIWYAVTYGGGLFVAVGQDVSNNGVISTSPDGVTWTPRTSNVARPLNCVAYGNGRYIAAADNATANSITTSTDGITWVTQDLRSLTAGSPTYQSIAYGNGMWALFSHMNMYYLTSYDAVNWTSRTSAISGIIAANGGPTLFGGGVWVALGYGKIATSGVPAR